MKRNKRPFDVQAATEKHSRWFAANHTPAPEPILRKPSHKVRCGLDMAAYGAMFKTQDGRCSICGDKPEKRLVVDHDHATGKIRALLCNGCNSALGFIRDNPDTARKMADYLINHKL